MTNQCTEGVASRDGLRRRLEERQQHNSAQETVMKECEREKSDISEIQPHEWFLGLLYDTGPAHLFFCNEGKGKGWGAFNTGPTAEIANLFHGITESICGISGEDVDLRGGELLARRGATPYEVTYWIYYRHEFNLGKIPTPHYIDGIVYRVYLKLFVEGVADGKLKCLKGLSDHIDEWMYSKEAREYRHEEYARRHQRTLAGTSTSNTDGERDLKFRDRDDISEKDSA